MRVEAKHEVSARTLGGKFFHAVICSGQARNRFFPQNIL
jgi:hypothetical protein